MAVFHGAAECWASPLVPNFTAESTPRVVSDRQVRLSFHYLVKGGNAISPRRLSQRLTIMTLLGRHTHLRLR